MTTASSNRRSIWLEIAETMLLALFIFFAARLFIQTFSIEGRSMQPNFQPKQYALVSKASYGMGSPERGDVIVLYRPGNPTEELLKRIVGLPGDKIQFLDGSVFVNGQKLDESDYLGDESTGRREGLVVPADSYFVLGDNRSVSKDSRSFGPVPRAAIVGKVLLIYWPIAQARTVPNPDLSI